MGKSGLDKLTVMSSDSLQVPDSTDSTESNPGKSCVNFSYDKKDVNLSDEEAEPQVNCCERFSSGVKEGQRLCVNAIYWLKLMLLVLSGMI